jgi:hypothetical protein
MTGSSGVRLKAFKEIEKMAIARVSDDCSYLCKGL